MTTIAYRSGTLCADSQVTSGDRIYRTTKIVRLPDGGLFGGAGGLADILKVRKWVESNLRKEPPELSDKANFECLWVKPDGSMWLIDDDLEPMQFTGDYIALGTGSPYALAAMYLGKEPAEAIEISAHFDPSTSLPIHTLLLTDHAQDRRTPKARKPRAKG